MSTVEEKDFGRDHWSMLAYLECRVTDNQGTIDRLHLRVDPRRHPGFAHSAEFGLPDKTPLTRLSGGRTLEDHDDIDCIEDLEAVGLVVDEMTGMGGGRVRLTGRGHELAAAIRAHKAGGGSFGTFERARS